MSIALQIAQLVAMMGQLGTGIFTMVYTKEMLDSMTDINYLIGKARGLSLEFDKTIVEYSSKVYEYFEQIVSGTLITPEIVNDIMGRLYVFVGIAIMFKLASVFIKYIISPETFQDTKQGAGKLVQRVILGVILIALIPSIFDLGYRLQEAVISDRIIEKTLLPADVYKGLTSGNNIGNKMVMTTFQGFFRWNEQVDKGNYPKIYNAYEKVMRYDTTSISSFDANYISEKQGSEYVISYTPILSTLAIGYILYTLIKYSLEVLLRSLKLAFLQIVAPFFIVNYMLKPGTDESFKKWVNMTVSNYLTIFLRVLTIWIAGLISYYLRYGVPNELGGTTSLITTGDSTIKAFIVVATFAFLKDLPKMFSELTGYNLQENEAIGGIMQQGLGLVKGFAMAKVGSSIAKEQLEKTQTAQFVSMGAGALGGAAGGMSGDGSKLTKGLNAGVQGIGAGMKDMGSITGGYRSAISVASPFGNIGSAASVSAYSGYSGPYGGVGGRTQIEANERREGRNEGKARNDTVNNLTNENNNDLHLMANTELSTNNQKTFNLTQPAVGGNGITGIEALASSLTNQLKQHGCQVEGNNITITETNITDAITQINSSGNGHNIDMTRVTHEDLIQISDASIANAKGNNGAKKVADANSSSEGV